MTINDSAGIIRPALALCDAAAFRGLRARSRAVLMSDADVLRVRTWIEDDALTLRECSRRLGVNYTVLLRRLSYRNIVPRMVLISTMPAAKALLTRARKNK